MIQLLIIKFPFLYRTEVMSVSDAKEFLEKNKFPKFVYLTDRPVNQFEDESKELYDFVSDKEINEDYFFTEALDECYPEEFYKDYTGENLDIPFWEFFKDRDDNIFGLGFDFKLPYLESLEKCQECDVVKMPIIELKGYLEEKIPLNEELSNLEFDENDIPCIVYYKNKIDPEITNFMILNRFSYLKNKFLTEPDSLVKVKKLFFEV